MEGESFTYRDDLYYINEEIDLGRRRERVVPRWRWWLERLLHPRKYKVNGNVLREPTDWERFKGE